MPAARPQYGVLELVIRFMVTLALLAILLAVRDDTPGLAGVVVGLVAGHWLPAPRQLRQTDNDRRTAING